MNKSIYNMNNVGTKIWGRMVNFTMKSIKSVDPLFDYTFIEFWDNRGNDTASIYMVWNLSMRSNRF